MKVAVINFSGNVGKTTASRHLIAPRIANTPDEINDIIISIESINADGNEVEENTILGKQFADLLQAMAINDNVVVDIGASNVEDFIGRMEQYSGSHEDFDYFVVPTVADKKQMRDTLKTVATLADLGIAPKKIRVLFNAIDPNVPHEKQFYPIYDYHQDNKNFVLKADNSISENDFYSRVRGDQTIDAILSDPTDYKEMIKATSDRAEKLKIQSIISTKLLAVGVKKELDSVFKSLFK